MNDKALPVPANKPKHLFQKGVSGNPAGRPKGSKNAITLVKLQIEGELRAQMKSAMPDIVSEILRQALPTQQRDKNGELLFHKDGSPVLLPGSSEMLKLLYGSWVSKTKAGDEEAPKDKIQIVIGKLDQIPPINGKTYEQSNNDNG